MNCAKLANVSGLTVGGWFQNWEGVRGEEQPIIA